MTALRQGEHAQLLDGSLINLDSDSYPAVILLKPKWCWLHSCFKMTHHLHKKKQNLDRGTGREDVLLSPAPVSAKQPTKDRASNRGEILLFHDTSSAIDGMA